MLFVSTMHGETNIKRSNDYQPRHVSPHETSRIFVLDIFVNSVRGMKDTNIFQL